MVGRLGVYVVVYPCPASAFSSPCPLTCTSDQVHGCYRSFAQLSLRRFATSSLNPCRLDVAYLFGQPPHQPHPRSQAQAFQRL
ncbi:hypothetical protein HDV57DRAFT_364548 [Trichoderma longibrachiatum]